MFSKNNNTSQPLSPEELLIFFTTHELIIPFTQSISEIIETFPSYTTEIDQPIDLITISDNLKSGKYKTIYDLADGLRLMFRNAMAFNSPELEVYKAAETLLGILEEKIKPKKLNLKVIEPKSRSNHLLVPKFKKVSNRRITRSISTQFGFSSHQFKSNFRTNKSEDEEDDDEDFALNKNRKRYKSKLSREQNIDRSRKRRRKKSKRKSRDRKRRHRKRHRHRHTKKNQKSKTNEELREDQTFKTEEKVTVPLHEIKKDVKKIERIGIDYNIRNKSDYVYQAHEYAEDLAFDLFSILQNIDFEKRDIIRQKEKNKMSNKIPPLKETELKNQTKSYYTSKDYVHNNNCHKKYNNDHVDNTNTNINTDIQKPPHLIQTKPITEKITKETSTKEKQLKPQKTKKKTLSTYPILTCGKMRIEKNNNYQLGKVPFYISESSFQNKLHSKLENEIKNLKSNVDFVKTTVEQGNIYNKNQIPNSPEIDHDLKLHEIISFAPEIPQLNSEGLGEIFEIIVNGDPLLAGKNNINIDLASISNHCLKQIKKYLIKYKKNKEKFQYD
ncbi:bromodomain-containing protein [Anaeramoeba flamelloides]|uniref:Bromodomain-containing protein n=1 Tax=Anaeramoeba flamelloides TaxID=1746091 RepID=A0ABQ8XR35_9EUKA|nr:bromodomain-containing protein [Anaeramoeba flamelloides]